MLGHVAARMRQVPESVGRTDDGDDPGDEFDERWSALMIEHNERSVSLAEEVQREGSYRQLDNMASGMIVDLGLEISELSSL